MQIHSVKIAPVISEITVFMNPIEYSKFASSYAHPGVKAVPTETGYLVTTDDRLSCLDGYLQRHEAEQYQAQYDQGIREMIVNSLQVPAPVKA